MMSAFFPTSWVIRVCPPIVFLVLGLLASRSGAADLPETQPLASTSVTLFVDSAPTDATFVSSFQTRVKELHPANIEAVASVNAFLPAGYSWRFDHGFGELHKGTSKLPCRVFQLVFPPDRKRSYLSRIRGVVREIYKDKDFQADLGCLAVAIVGVKSQDISSLFPVPFSRRPASLSNDLDILELFTSYRVLDASSSHKLEGAGPALLRDLVGQAVISKDAAADVLKKLEPYASQNAQQKAYVVGLLSDRNLMDRLRVQIEALKTAGYFSISPWLGKIAVKDKAVLDFGPMTTTVASTGAGGALTDPGIFVSLWPQAGPQGVTPCEGLAVPGLSGGLPVHVSVTSVVLGSLVWLEAALTRQLIRGWRWRLILDPGSQTPATPSHGLTQTLLRINEPLMDLITWTTVENKFTPFNPGGELTNTEGFDAVDVNVVDSLIQDARGMVLSPGAARSASSLIGMHPGAADGFYPCSEDLIDHVLNRSIYKAMSGKRKKGGGQDAAGSPPDEAAIAMLEKAVVELMAGGFHRPSRVLPLADALAGEFQGRGPSTPPTDPTLEPDLVWLRRAMSPPAAEYPATWDGGDHPLAHPFIGLQGTQIPRYLDVLMGDTGDRWISIESASAPGVPATPQLPDGTRFFILTWPSYGPVKAILAAWVQTYRESARASERAYQALAPGFTTTDHDTFTASVASSGGTTSGDLLSWYYGHEKVGIETTLENLEKKVSPLQGGERLEATILTIRRETDANWELTGGDDAATQIFLAAYDQARNAITEIHDNTPTLTAADKDRARETLGKAVWNHFQEPSELLSATWKEILLCQKSRKPSGMDDNPTMRRVEKNRMQGVLRALAKATGLKIVIREGSGTETTLQ